MSVNPLHLSQDKSLASLIHSFNFRKKAINTFKASSYSSDCKSLVRSNRTLFKAWLHPKDYVASFSFSLSRRTSRSMFYIPSYGGRRWTEGERANSSSSFLLHSIGPRIPVYMYERTNGIFHGPIQSVSAPGLVRLIKEDPGCGNGARLA